MAGLVLTAVSHQTSADPLLHESATTLFQGVGEAIDDDELSSISGKGTDHPQIQYIGVDSLAVILWDESGRGRNRGAGHTYSGSAGNVQSTKVTIRHQ